MGNIMEELRQWGYLHELPPLLAGFILEMKMKENGLQYEIFTYLNATQYRNFTVIYDSATKDFLVRITVGLIEYCDISFISQDLAILESSLRDRMETVLYSLAGLDNNATVCSIFRQKKIIEWPYAAQLPAQLAGFQLFVNPKQPVKIINGSYIVIDYSDFSDESNLIIYYNIFRDEFFGEARVKRTPQMIAVFDADSLIDLEEKLQQNLESVLKDIRVSLGTNHQ